MRTKKQNPQSATPKDKPFPNVSFDPRTNIQVTDLDHLSSDKMKLCLSLKLNSSAHIIAHKDEVIKKNVLDRSDVEKIEKRHIQMINKQKELDNKYRNAC